MSDQRADRSTQEVSDAAQVPRRAAAPARSTSHAGDEATPCPACGSEMRLWANYHRCRNCGYKESCCF